MGFLKFLKREKKEALDELDLPPAPPPLEGPQADFGAYADFDKDLPELPDFPDFEKERISAPEGQLPKMDFPEIEEKTPDIDKWKSAQDFPAFPEIEEKPMPPITPIAPIAPISTPSIISESIIQTPQMVTPKQEAAAQSRQMDFSQQEPYEPYQKIKIKPLEQEKRELRQSLSAGPVYVRIDKFKGTLGSINMIRSDLRRSEEALTKLENIKNVKDKSFDKLKSSMDDLQKKLIFIDKTLFKGD